MFFFHITTTPLYQGRQVKKKICNLLRKKKINPHPVISTACTHPATPTTLTHFHPSGTDNYICILMFSDAVDDFDHILLRNV